MSTPILALRWSTNADPLFTSHDRWSRTQCERENEFD